MWSFIPTSVLVAVIVVILLTETLVRAYENWTEDL